MSNAAGPLNVSVVDSAPIGDSTPSFGGDCSMSWFAAVSITSSDVEVEPGKLLVYAAATTSGRPEPAR
jgi:hypothetical protein